MKIALVHDWLDKYGGAERVVNSLDSFINFNYYFAYADIMSDEDKKVMFNGKVPEISSSYFLQFLGNKFRYALPLFPMITKIFNKQVHSTDVDLVITSSWCLSKGFRINHEKQVCYMQARNFKYVWDEYDNYFKGIVGILFIPIRQYLRAFDKRMAQNPDFIVANSKYVQGWIKEHYNRDSFVIYPPVAIENFSLRTLEIKSSDYFVTVGRLVQYKRFDLLIKAFTTMKKKLIIIGDGAERSNLEKLAAGSEYIIFKGFLGSQEINKFISNARAFVFSSLEDFGIAPVEAQACGTPVIAFGKGGVLETIIDNKTGVFFYSQEAKEIEAAITKFEENIETFNPIEIRKNAEKYSSEAFKSGIQMFLAKNKLI